MKYKQEAQLEAKV